MLGRFLTALGLAGLLMTANCQTNYDFAIGLRGPVTATRGYPLFLQIDSRIVQGQRSKYALATAAPKGIVASYPQLDQFCCGAPIGWTPQQGTLLRLDLAPTAPLGEQTITVTMTSGGVSHSAQWTINVVAAGQGVGAVQAAPVRSRLPQSVGDPSLTAAFRKWKGDMLSIGRSFCDGDYIVKSGTWEGNVWYYDGLRVMYQIADYTGDPAWLDCAEKVRGVYLGYVMQSGDPKDIGRVTGWRVFPAGLRLDYERTGRQDSKLGIIGLAEHSAYSSLRGNVDVKLSRETAFLLQAQTDAAALEPRNFQFHERAVAEALGHLDQWFVGGVADEPGAAEMQPFMVGLTVSALIQHFEATGDPRVQPAVENALAKLWDWAWIPDQQAFWYSRQTSDFTKGAPDLNQLIAPGYAWLYARTGAQVWRDRAFAIFTGGALGACTGCNGKHFSQQYRDSFNTVRWLGLR